MTWNTVESTVSQARGIAWDGCHKIYVLMDDEQMRQMAEWGYGEDGSQLLPVDAADPEVVLATLTDWYENSCGLRFISAVSTVDGDPNDGFTHLIAQFEDEDAEQETS